MNQPGAEPPSLIEGRDYYIERGAWVFTREFLLRRGKCCSSGCRHCPYRDQANKTPPEAAEVSG